MPVFALAPAAATAFWGATAAGVTAGAGLYGAHKAGQAAEKGAAIAAGSADRAAELQSQGNREALQFAREQAEADYQNYEVANRANYEQNAARERRLGTLGGLIGRSPREIPAYQASIDPNFTGGGRPGGAPGGAPAGGGDPKLQAFIAQWQQTHPASEGVAPLAAAIAQQFPGVTRFDYGGGRLSNNELNVGGQKYKVLGGEDSPASAYWYQPGMDDSAPGRTAPTTLRAGAMQPGTLGGYVPLTARLPMTAPLQMGMPRRYAPGSLGGYLGGY
jgi:hypothetical protein